MADELKRQAQKLRAVRMAQNALKHRLETIDFVMDVVTPEQEALKAAYHAKGELPGIEVIEDAVSDEHTQGS